MTDTVFEALREDHEIQRRLVDRLIETSGDSDEREELYRRLDRELRAHAEAEERYFYVPLMEEDLTQDKARHSVAEHKELDDFLDDLDEADRSSAQWLATAKKLRERLVHHLDEEEQEVFQLAGKALGEEQKTELAASYRTEIDRRREQH